MRLALRTAVTLSLLLGAATAPGRPPLDPPQQAGGVALGLVLRRLPVTTRLLYVTAHPDDEHNGLLVRLSRGQGIRTALLCLTRGEGGQNAIGGELGEALAVLRAGELDAVHRYDGVVQLFGRARDFGLSFSVEESLQTWGAEATLGDIVQVVREFRPDVIVTLPPEASGGGQHHQAASRLALQAFRAAADPKRFAEQIERGLAPFQPRKIYVTGTGGGGAGRPGPVLRLSTAQYDPLLGGTWEEVGREARAFHRSQGMGPRPGIVTAGEALLQLVDAEPPVVGVESDLTDGLPSRLVDLPVLLPEPARSAKIASALDAAAAALEEAARLYDARDPARVIAPLARASASVERALGVLSPGDGQDAALKLGQTRSDLHHALALAHGLTLDATSNDTEAVAGQTVRVTLSAIHHGPAPIEIVRLAPRVLEGWSVRTKPLGPVTLAPGAALSQTFEVELGANAKPTPEDGLRASQAPLPGDEGRARLLSPPAPLVASLTWRAGDAQVVTQTPVAPFDVAPPLSLEPRPQLLVEPIGSPRALEVRVAVRNHTPGPAQATVSLDLPPGYSAEPPTHSLRFAGQDEEQRVRFSVRPPRHPVPGRFEVTAHAHLGNERYAQTLEAVDYPHVTRRLRLEAARSSLVVLDVRTRPGARVAFVPGTGDTTGEAVAALGIAVDTLGQDELAFADLWRYTTILVGVRAYEVRPDLRLAHARLLDWVRAGGHLVVQYQREAWNAGSAQSPFAPYPAAVTSRRVSDERAALERLVPFHPILASPNAIGEADFDGWVQERGIALLETKDARYVDLLASEDPFPNNPGRKTGLLVTTAVGKGTWTYVGLGLFRQLPAGVPGAFRLLANLVCRPGAPPARPVATPSPPSFPTVAPSRTSSILGHAPAKGATDRTTQTTRATGRSGFLLGSTRSLTVAPLAPGSRVVPKKQLSLRRSHVIANGSFGAGRTAPRRDCGGGHALGGRDRPSLPSPAPGPRYRLRDPLPRA